MSPYYKPVSSLTKKRIKKTDLKESPRGLNEVIYTLSTSIVPGNCSIHVMLLFYVLLDFAFANGITVSSPLVIIIITSSKDNKHLYLTMFVLMKQLSKYLLSEYTE